jgi:hypothetical protein
MIFIIAGNVRQAVEYATRCGLIRSEWRYVEGPSSLRGYSVGELRRVGTWHQRRDYAEVMDMARERRIGVQDA